MTPKLILATAVAVLAGCAAGPQVSTTGSSSAASPGTYYCWKERLSTEGDGLVCNWEASASEACRSTSFTTLKRSAVAGEPRNSTLCTNGQWLVAVTTR